jgi:cell wall assembly regulator SMI1
MAELKDIQPPPSDAAIALLEKETQRKFPEDVVAFLQKYNGARTDGIPLPSAEREVVIERFLSVAEPGAEHPLSPYDIAVVTAPMFERFLGSETSDSYDLIPFAALFAGDMLCLDYRAGNTPSVVHWNHEKSRDFKPATALVAHTFADFLQMIDLQP